MKKNFKENSNNYGMECIFYYLRRIVFQFQLLQLVHLTDRWPNIYEIMMNLLTGQHLPSSAINNKKESWKIQCGSAQRNVYNIEYQKNMEITVAVC